MNASPPKSALDMTPSEYAAALHQLRRGGATHVSDQTSPDTAIAKPGVENGTTTSTQRAPLPSADKASGDALSMTSAEWQAAVRNLR